MLNTLWNGRKAKTSGTVNLNGTDIPFDFTNCTDDLLLALAGHMHMPGVDHVGGTSSGLLQVCFDYFFKKQITFGLIDRRTQKIECWTAIENSTTTPQSWEAAF